MFRLSRTEAVSPRSSTILAIARLLSTMSRRRAAEEPQDPIPISTICTGLLYKLSMPVYRSINNPPTILTSSSETVLLRRKHCGGLIRIAVAHPQGFFRFCFGKTELDKP